MRFDLHRERGAHEARAAVDRPYAWVGEAVVKHVPDGGGRGASVGLYQGLVHSLEIWADLDHSLRPPDALVALVALDVLVAGVALAALAASAAAISWLIPMKSAMWAPARTASAI